MRTLLHILLKAALHSLHSLHSLNFDEQRRRTRNRAALHSLHLSLALMASPSWPFPRRVFPHVVWVAAEAVHEQESVATRDMLVQAIIGAGFGGGTEDFLHSAEELLGHLNVDRRSRLLNAFFRHCPEIASKNKQSRKKPRPKRGPRKGEA